MEENNVIQEEKKDNKGTILTLSIIGTISVVVIAFCLSYFVYTDFQNTALQKATTNISGATKEIDLAKNTLFNNGIVSVMIENIDSSAEWKYFISDTGVSVVEVSGLIEESEIPSFIDATNSSRVGRISTELNRELAENIVELEFRIQFAKQLGIKNDTPYDNYQVGYTEYILTDMDGEITSLNAYSSEIFDVMGAYLASKW